MAINTKGTTTLVSCSSVGGSSTDCGVAVGVGVGVEVGVGVGVKVGVAHGVGKSQSVP